MSGFGDPSVGIGWAGRAFGLLKALAGHVLRFMLIDLPVLLAVSVLPFLAAAGLLWYIAAPNDPAIALPAAILLFGCYGLAGLVWGLRVAMARLVSSAVASLEKDSPALADAVLPALLARTPLADRRIEIAAIRDGWNEATRPLLFHENDNGCRRSSLMARVGNWPLRRLLRARTAALESLLASVERQGETHLSAESLAGVLREKLVALAVEDARRRLAVVNACGYLLTVFLVSLPLLVG